MKRMIVPTKFRRNRFPYRECEKCGEEIKIGELYFSSSHVIHCLKCVGISEEEAIEANKDTRLP